MHRHEGFQLFPALPGEIQDLIWDFAARPLRSCNVQYFLLADHYYNRFSKPKIPLPGDFLMINTDTLGFHVAVPHYNPQFGMNDSAYELNKGLWTACMASQQSMRRVYPGNIWCTDVDLNETAPEIPKVDTDAGQEIRHTVAYLDANKDTNFITIAAREDLFYFRFLDITSVDWWHLRSTRHGSPRDAFMGEHLAFEYDARMMQSLKNQLIHTCYAPINYGIGDLVDMIDMLHEHAEKTVYFVDHRLQRTTTTSPIADDDSPKTFRSANCLFTVVNRQDMHSKWIIGGLGNGNDVGVGNSDNSHVSAFDFIDELDRAHGGRIEIERSDRMKVLACEVAVGSDYKHIIEWESPDAVCERCNWDNIPRDYVPTSIVDSAQIAETTEESVDLGGFFD